MTQYIKKLPAVFQTVTEKKFFDATFDQVFSKKDSDMLAGFIGRRNPGEYNPISDFYLPEPSKNRTWWQLEATAYARTEDTTKSNIFFYEDLLDRIEYYGGNTLNQDRLFESQYYSFGPPIDYDMFINYQNYYWVEQGLAVINISGVQGVDIVGQTSYTTPLSATPPGLTLTTGMKIQLLDDAINYPNPMIIENIGLCEGIRLVPQFPDFTSGTIFEFLPWDGSITLSTGRIIEDLYWDMATWDTQTQPTVGDYLTIERGSVDRNAWSRTNKWFHIDTINTVVQLTGTQFPGNSTRALRPIIQFIADLQLFRSGTRFIRDIQYGLRDDSTGQPILLSDLQLMQIDDINNGYNMDLQDGDLVVFFNDTTEIDVSSLLWMTFDWDASDWDAAQTLMINNFIFIAEVQLDGRVAFSPSPGWSDYVVDGDIVLVDTDGPYNAAQRGQSWYYEGGQWSESFNDKTKLNQPPLFQLYDHNGVFLDDVVTYPGSNFLGSEIFSYKVNAAPGATVDPVLKFPIVYTSLGQASDIIFQNDLMTNRYTYSDATLSIDGYYYYKSINNTILYNSWNLHTPCPCDANDSDEPWMTFDWDGGEWENSLPITISPECITSSKQRVIDKFVVGFGSEFKFKLSVTPYGYPIESDIIVSVNDVEIRPVAEQANGYSFVVVNNSIYVDLTTYITNLLTVTQTVAPVVELQTYTHGLLDPAEKGYFEIPQQLEANPTQLEVLEISGSELSQQFASIISNQRGFTGVAFGGTNNYRNTEKNRSVGTYILQNIAPALKSMLVSSSDDLDFILAERFSQDEYTKFKNKYLRTALQLINSGFNPVQYFNNTIVVSAWVDEILKTVNISKEFSSAFAYSYMIASGEPNFSESHTIPGNSSIILTNYVDLNNPKNALYIYDNSTSQEKLLVIGRDYELITTDFIIEVQMKLSAGNKVLVFNLFEDALPAYIPSTPTKIGAYSTFMPRIELDTSYATPTTVIIGHDGSKTIAFGDYRDRLLLELECRIYNLLQYRYRNQYYLPLRIESVKSGFFRQTRYSRDEYLDITESYLNKWSAKNRANYRTNEWATVSPSTPVGSLWKLYNYSSAITPGGVNAGLHGNWKGIFQYYYDTVYPDTRPWEMLGFSDQPSWWVSEYGPGSLNLAGQTVWPSTATSMWLDIENGIIRQGPSAIYDPVTLDPQPQQMWVRDGLSTLMPVDAAGEIIPVPTIFQLQVTGNPYAPFDEFDADWVYGDGSPVEQTWLSSSAYPFSVQEFLYLMRPAPYGELLWDTLGTELSPGQLVIPGVDGPVMSNTNWQYVQNDVYTNADQYFAWMRPKNKDQVVHAETVDGVVQVRFGYQRWISDRILFLGKTVGTEFGQKIRTLDVNLANKFAGFTNKDTTNTYIEAVAPGATTNTLIIPTTNFDVFLHKSPPVDRYSYSGIIIRALEDGTFAVYGYDLLKSEFTVLNRTTNKLIDISVGGTPAEFRYFTPGATYVEGEIVRYNGVYYQSAVTQTVQRFESLGWQKLRALPTIGGISVTYKPVSDTTTSTVPYGSILKTPQAVFDLMIGWGAYLESQGWKFDEVSTDTNLVSDWLASAKQFLFWLNTSWAPDASIQLSPLANKATLVVSRGYPNDVETLSNGVYSIMDKYGVAIAPNNIATDRDGSSITVEPANLSTGGIYFLQVTASETEHILIFDNTTSFNDTVYSPLLRARQQRLRFNGFRSNAWYGKMEAPGYLVIDNQLVPNFDTIVESMRYFYDPNVTIDNPSLEDLGRHLIGYESKSYLDNLQVSNDVQYLFYQGAIRQKGTQQAFDKLFRSTKIQSDEVIEVYEEWALKLGDFGNTVEQVSTEFRLTPEQNTGEVIVARLNFTPSSIGFLRQVNILNAENTYTSVPRIVISAPDATPAVTWSVFTTGAFYQTGSIVQVQDAQGNFNYYSSNIDQTPSAFVPANWTLVLATRFARAFAVLGTDGRISRVDITDNGYGYLSAPLVSINSGSQPNNLDRLFGIWQGEIIKDATLDNIVNIDIDQPDQWTVRPNDPAYSLEFPVTNNIVYPIPNAGYVNFNDVDWHSFDAIETSVTWGTDVLNPAAQDTIWIAKTFTEDWAVYKLVNISPSPAAALPWRVVADETGALLLLTTIGTTIVPQFSTSVSGNRTDFGSMIVLQQVTSGVVNRDVNYTVSFAPYTTTDYDNPGTYVDPDTLDVYNAYILQTLDGTPITNNEIGDYSDFNALLLYKTLRWLTKPVEPNLPSYVGLGDYVWVDDVSAKWVVYEISAGPADWNSFEWDGLVDNFWKPYYGWDIAGPMYFVPRRIQGTLINTSLFENASVFADSGRQLVQLPVYDPFKNILPGPARQNISYMSFQDPARYNVTGNTRLFSENITFGDRQVGQLWWDLSFTRFVYYEQPIVLSGAETETDNLVYRRDNWARLFPGSTVDIYEWVKSSVPPESYTGTGVPRDITSYVQISTSNRFTGVTEINYYFWVLGATDKPNIENRTLAAVDVSRLLQTPKSQGFAFFAPIQQTETNNAYMFYNVQEILAYQGDNIQVRYRLSERDDQEHAQWSLFREGDSASLVSDQYWDKMVDSLCEYTRVLPVSDEYANGIVIGSDLPWGSYGWGVASWDSASATTTPVYGEILQVPDPTLSSAEKYGIRYRPLQSMFVKLQAARKVFVQSANALLQYIPIRDDDPSWDANVATDTFWTYTNWYAVGYEGVTPNVVYTNLSNANTALISGQLSVGDIVQVTSGTLDGRFILYAVTQLNPNIPVLSFEEVGVQNSAIKLLDTIYTTINDYGLSVELRQLLSAFRDTVMIDSYIVDQNELFFSMVNYVVSEQRNPNWVFKTSYIYIKENNIPLQQTKLYAPDQIDNIINYIVDAKPYHTQIRDYTSTYVTSDIADGTASDSHKMKMTIQFGPTERMYYAPFNNLDVMGGALLLYAWDAYGEQEWDTAEWDGFDISQVPNQFVARNNVLPTYDSLMPWPDTYEVPLTFFDASKIGYSELFPYTFDFDGLNLDDPQTFITPANIVAAKVGADTLFAGQDFYVVLNTNGTYTIYFFNSPSVTPVALVWWDGGQLLNPELANTVGELANGYATDDLVINVDTRLPVNDMGDGTYTAYNDMWDFADPIIDGIIQNLGSPPMGFGQAPWSQGSTETPSTTTALLTNCISFKENTNVDDGSNFYRNAQKFQGTLLIDLPAPTLATENIDVITVYVDPVTHPLGTDILPDPVADPGVIWIRGERIEYKLKTAVAPDTWELRLVRRGTMGTAPTNHTALIPSLANPLVLVPNPVWVEEDNIISFINTNTTVWNAVNSAPDVSTQQFFPWDMAAWMVAPTWDNATTGGNNAWDTDQWMLFLQWNLAFGKYTNITSVPLGGLWYAQTSEALFLKQEQGISIP